MTHALSCWAHFSDLRSSLSAASVGHLTLALFYVRKWVKEKMAQSIGVLERQELALHFEAVGAEKAEGAVDAEDGGSDN